MFGQYRSRIPLTPATAPYYVASGLLTIAFSLIAWWLISRTVDPDIDLRAHCDAVEPGSPVADVLEALGTQFYAPRCGPDIDCTTFVDRSGRQWGYRCDAEDCAMYWFSSVASCRVPILSGRALSPGERAVRERDAAETPW